MRWVLLVGTTIAVVLAQTFVRADEQQPEERKTTVVRVLPLIELDATSDMRIQLVFENTSSEPIRYLPGGDRRSVHRLNFVLRKNGTAIVPIMSGELVALTEDRVQTIPPGGEVIHTLKIREVYGELKPGRYILTARMEGSPKDFGLTNVWLDQTVLHLNVVKS